MPTHFQPSSYQLGTSCRCCKETEREQERRPSTSEPEPTSHPDLLFHRDLPVLVGVEGNADVSGVKHTRLSVTPDTRGCE